MSALQTELLVRGSWTCVPKRSLDPYGACRVFLIKIQLPGIGFGRSSGLLAGLQVFLNDFHLPCGQGVDLHDLPQI